MPDDGRNNGVPLMLVLVIKSLSRPTDNYWLPKHEADALYIAGHLSLHRSELGVWSYYEG